MPSIENWDSIGIDWNYPQLCTYYSALESIRLALVERDLATSGFSPAILTGQVLLLYSLREYAEAIQNTITSLIPCFANHTDNGGNWDGKTDIPAWTESSILEAIGAEKRLLVNKLNVLSAAWVTQQYQILNMLKWRLVKINYNNRSDGINDNIFDAKIRTGNAQYIKGLNNAITMAKNHWNEDSWRTYYGGGYPGASSFSAIKRYGTSDFYDIDFTTIADSMLVSNFVQNNYLLYDPSANYQASVDFYGFAYNSWAYNESSPYGTYNSQEGFLQNKWTLLDSQTESAGIEKTGPKYWFVSKEIGNREIQIDPTNPPSDSSQYVGYDLKLYSGNTPIIQPDINLSRSTYIRAAVLKYDGSNGFKFKDW